MDPVLSEWLSLALRWAHIITGIAWIGFVAVAYLASPYFSSIRTGSVDAGAKPVTFA